MVTTTTMMMIIIIIVKINIAWWWSGIAIVRWSRSRMLIYVGPG